MKTKFKKITALAVALCAVTSIGLLGACGETPDGEGGGNDAVTQYIPENKNYAGYKALDYDNMSIVWQGATNKNIASYESDLEAQLLINCYGETGATSGTAAIYQAGLWTDDAGTYWADKDNHIAIAYYGTWTFEYSDVFSCNTLKLVVLGPTSTSKITDSFKANTAEDSYEIEFNDIEAENPAGELYSYSFSNLRKYLFFYGKGKTEGYLGHSVKQGQQTNPDGSGKVDEEGNPVMGDVVDQVTDAKLQMKTTVTYKTVADWAKTLTIK